MASFGISVIICVYNGAERIIPTLKALSEQNIPSGLPCELLLIDNASTDSTSSIVKEYWKNIGYPFPISFIFEPKAGKANALVKGYNESKYELMLVCDDDNRLQPNYFKIVAELYTTHPDIGLLGGYGKALFNPGEKPSWFDSWQNCYVCGKHHFQNGFLNGRDFSIWGAGSVLRKSMWKFFVTNGFVFFNSVKAGKAMSEDAELSMAITFTGHQLYFDERLWFIHDLSGGRITWENFIEQQSWNGKTNAILYMYQISYDHPGLTQSNIHVFFIKKISGLSWHFCKSVLKRKNRPKSVFFYHIIKELITNAKKYKQQAIKSSKWINKIKHSKPFPVSGD